MKIRTYKRFIKTGFRSVFRNRVMSLASVSSIVAALFVLGLMLAIVYNVNHITGSLESIIEVTVFMKEGTSEEAIRGVESQINNWEGVYEVEYISKQQALEKWKEELGEQKSLLEGYTQENNPLPDYFVLRIEKPEYLENVVLKAKALESVEKVNYSKEVAKVLDRFSSTVRAVGAAIVLLLVSISIIIVYNTVKLTVYSRKREITIMKYVGATDWYIRWPFIIEGFTLGIIGSLLAAGLVMGMYYLITAQYTIRGDPSNFMSMFELLPLETIVWPVVVIFIAVGSGIGTVASALSIRKHLEA